MAAQRDVPHLARRRAAAASSRTTRPTVVRRHGGARRRAPDPGRAGQRPGRPLELQGRQVRIVLGRDQRHAAADVHDAAERARPRPSRSPSSRCARSRSIHDLVTDVSWNFRVKKSIKKFKPRPPDAPDGTWRMQQVDVDRVQEFRKCIECFLCQDVCHVLRDHHMHDEFIGPRFLVYAAALEMHPLDTEDRVARPEERRTASATATSPSAAPRSVRRASRSPTTRSFR